MKIFVGCVVDVLSSLQYKPRKLHSAIADRFSSLHSSREQQNNIFACLISLFGDHATGCLGSLFSLLFLTRAPSNQTKLLLCYITVLVFCPQREYFHQKIFFAYEYDMIHSAKKRTAGEGTFGRAPLRAVKTLLTGLGSEAAQA